MLKYCKGSICFDFDPRLLAVSLYDCLVRKQRGKKRGKKQKAETESLQAAPYSRKTVTQNQCQTKKPILHLIFAKLDAVTISPCYAEQV